MIKLKKPEIVLQWERIAIEPPKVCWMCDHLSMGTGKCEKYGMEPPADFAETPGACEEWVCEVPF